MSEMKKGSYKQAYKKRAWLLVFLCFIAISLASMGMLIILNHFLPLDSLPTGFVKAGLLYTETISIIITVLIYFTVRKKLINPIDRLDKAASQVARGDFSVYVEPSKDSYRNSPVDTLIENFNAMVDDLASIETMKIDFVSNVSHEIRTPLGNIQNYAYALKDPNVSPEKKLEYADIIIESCNRLNVMVTNLLKLNKLENQMTKFVIEEYDLCEQLSDCILGFEKTWTDKNIDIELDTEDRAVISADKDMLGIVWVNLLSNAFKFTDYGGRVMIKQVSDGDRVTVTITDTGCGMTAETQRRMFDKFYQGDTSHSSEGNGLGMALVFRILQLMQGDLSVESEVGKGTSFILNLPRKYCANVVG